MSDGEKFFDSTAFVAHILENWPAASDADIAAVKMYSEAIDTIIQSDTFPSPLMGVAFCVGLTGSTHHGLAEFLMQEMQ